MTKSEENIILQGNLNTQVGKMKRGNIISKYGLWNRNVTGERLIEFCTEHRLTIANTIFQNHKIRSYTWRNLEDMTRYQLD